jgi:hypothetical protein
MAGAGPVTAAGAFIQIAASPGASKPYERMGGGLTAARRIRRKRNNIFGARGNVLSGSHCRRCAVIRFDMPPAWPTRAEVPAETPGFGFLHKCSRKGSQRRAMPLLGAELNCLQKFGCCCRYLGKPDSRAGWCSILCLQSAGLRICVIVSHQIIGQCDADVGPPPMGVEREEGERHQQLEQARIDRLVDEPTQLVEGVSAKVD